MTWGTDLWDQTDKVANYTQSGIDFLERFGNFIKDRATIELEYAKALNGLVKKYQPRRKDDEELNFSFVNSFLNGLQEILEIAQQHESLASIFRDKIACDVSSNVKIFKDERRQNLDYIYQLQQNAKTSVDEMNKAKKHYSDAFRAAEDAHLRYLKIENDLTYPRADVERRKTNFLQKSDMAEQLKFAYAAQLQKTNEQQHRHFKLALPSAFDKLQEIDNTRIKAFRRHFVRLTVEEGSCLSAIVNRLLAIQKHCDLVNAELDAEVVINRYKSGDCPQVDYDFADMIAENGMANNIPKNPNNDIGNLTPELKYNRTPEKLVEIERQIKLKIDQRNGCIKMQEVYRNNPSLGNPNTLDGEIRRFNAEIDRLNDEKKHYEAILRDRRKNSGQSSSTNSFDSANTPPTPKNIPNLSGRNSYTLKHDESIDEGVRSMPLGLKEDDFSKIKSATGTLTKKFGQLFPLKRLSGANGKTIQEQSSRNSTFDFDFDDQDDPVLGVGTALYDYKGREENGMEVKARQELYIVEQDNGDGWTKVRSKVDNTEGFVPTTYLQIEPF